MSVVHVVVGPPEHGVARHALDLLASPALAHHGVARAADAAGFDALAAAGFGQAWVHVHVTDRLFGGGAAAGERLGRLLGRGRVSLTLHDLPQPHDDGPTGRARAAAYVAWSRAADLLVVASEHERGLLARAGGDVDRCRVVPLPLAPRDPAAEARARAAAPGERTVGVLGFLYPGKGHDVALAAMEALPTDVDLLALGRPSPGHEYLADALAAAAAAQGRRARVTGFVPDADLPDRLRAVTVPAAPHEHVSASGSIGTWLSAGRRPVVADGPWVRELLRRLPGSVVPVACGDLPAALAAALDDPESTWLPGDLALTPTRDDAAAAYARLLDAAAGEGHRDLPVADAPSGAPRPADGPGRGEGGAGPVAGKAR